jgi:alkylhydroperoxidase family enzyme
MAYIQLIDEREATGRLSGIYEAARQRAGGVANILKMMSRDARSLESSIQFYVSLMKAPNALSAAQREMLAAVVSNANDCYY